MPIHSSILYQSGGETVRLSNTPPGRLKISNQIQFATKSLDHTVSHSSQSLQKKKIIYISEVSKPFDPSEDTHEMVGFIDRDFEYHEAEGTLLRNLFLEGFDIYLLVNHGGQPCLMSPALFKSIFHNLLKEYEWEDRNLHDILSERPDFFSSYENFDFIDVIESIDRALYYRISSKANGVFDLVQTSEYAGINKDLILAEAKQRHGLLANQVLIMDYLNLSCVYKQFTLGDDHTYHIQFIIYKESDDVEANLNQKICSLIQGISLIDQNASFRLKIENTTSHILKLTIPKADIIKLILENCEVVNSSIIKLNEIEFGLTFQDLSTQQGVDYLDKYTKQLYSEKRDIYCLVNAQAELAESWNKFIFKPGLSVKRYGKYKNIKEIALTNSPAYISFDEIIEESPIHLSKKYLYLVSEITNGFSIVQYQNKKEINKVGRVGVCYFYSRNDVLRIANVIQTMKVRGHLPRFNKIYVYFTYSSEAISFFQQGFPEFELYDKKGELISTIASAISRYKPLSIDFNTALDRTQAVKIFSVETPSEYLDIDTTLLVHPRNYIQVSPQLSLTSTMNPPHYGESIQTKVSLIGKEEIFLNDARTRATLSALSAFDESVSLQLTVRTSKQTYILNEEVYSKHFCNESNCWWVEFEEPIDEHAKLFAKHCIKVQSPDAGQIINYDNSTKYPEETNNQFVQNFIHGQDVPETDNPYLFWRFLEYVRTFEMKDFTSPKPMGDESEKLKKLALEKKGVCRHSTLVFKYLVELAQQKGIQFPEIKYKKNDCHSFIMAYLPQENGEFSWKKVDVVSRKTANLDTSNAFHLIDNSHEFELSTTIREKENDFDELAGSSEQEDGKINSALLDEDILKQNPTLEETMRALGLDQKKAKHVAHLLESVEDIEPFITTRLNNQLNKLFIINSPNSLKTLTQQFHVAVDGDIQRVDDSPLRFFAETMPDGNIVINLSKFTAKQIRQINGLFDDVAQLCGVQIPKTMNIICVMTSGQYESLGPDFKRRVVKAPIQMDISNEAGASSVTSLFTKPQCIIPRD